MPAIYKEQKVKYRIPEQYRIAHGNKENYPTNIENYKTGEVENLIYNRDSYGFQTIQPDLPIRKREQGTSLGLKLADTNLIRNLAKELKKNSEYSVLLKGEISDIDEYARG